MKNTQPFIQASHFDFNTSKVKQKTIILASLQLHKGKCILNLKGKRHEFKGYKQ